LILGHKNKHKQSLQRHGCKAKGKDKLIGCFCKAEKAPFKHGPMKSFPWNEESFAIGCSFF